jgi:hypothetical protein
MDQELRKLLAELVDALDAVIVAMQVEHGGQKPPGEADYSLKQAIHRVNMLRRAVQALDESRERGA